MFVKIQRVELAIDAMNELIYMHAFVEDPLQFYQFLSGATSATKSRVKFPILSPLVNRVPDN